MVGHGVRYVTRDEAASDLFQYIAVFYNRSRRHSTLGYLRKNARGWSNLKSLKI